MELGWLALGVVMIAFIFVIVSIFTIRGSRNSSHERQEISMIPLYISAILVFISAVLVAYMIFQKDKICTKVLGRHTVTHQIQNQIQTPVSTPMPNSNSIAYTVEPYASPGDTYSSDLLI